MSIGTLLAVGSYTEESGGIGNGITLLDFDRGGFRELASVRVPSPSFIAWTADGTKLLAVSEMRDGQISSFQMVGEQLEPLDVVDSLGSRPCHIALHPSEEILIVSHWDTGGFVVVPFRNGFFSRPTQVISPQGIGVHPTRQDRPHPHCAIFTPDGKWAILIDGGLDAVSVHQVDVPSRSLSSEPYSVSHSRPGSGPRHGVWLAADTLAVVQELDGTVALFHWNGRGALRRANNDQSTTATDTAFAWPSEITVTGADLLVANRGTGTLARISPSGPVRECRGLEGNARHFSVVDNIALVALQDTGVVKAIDMQSGALVAHCETPSAAFVAIRPH